MTLDADDAVELSGTRDPGRQWSCIHIGVAGCALVTRHRVLTSLIAIIIIIIIIIIIPLSQKMPVHKVAGKHPLNGCSKRAT